MFQKTIKNSFILKGRGIHFNEESILIFHPADPDFGIQFLVKSSGKKIFIKASLDSLSHSKYQLSLSSNHCVIHTVEHLLAAIYGLEISNCLIEIDGNEVPILDGSSHSYVQALFDHGILEQDSQLDIRVISNSIELYKDSSHLKVIPSPQFEISCEINYPHPMLEREFYQFQYSEENFIKEISKARTFGFLSEWESMKNKGYALGSSTQNTIVYDSDSLVNPPLRYPEECVRHKILDFIAALSLLDYRIQGSFHLYHSGHSIDTEFIKKVHSILA